MPQYKVNAINPVLDESWLDPSLVGGLSGLRNEEPPPARPDDVA